MSCQFKLKKTVDYNFNKTVFQKYMVSEACIFNHFDTFYPKHYRLIY